MAAVVSLRPMMTMAEGRTKTMNDDTATERDSSTHVFKTKYRDGRPCPVYGCPLFPLDIVARPPLDPTHNQLHAPTTLQSLEDIRNFTRRELLEEEKKKSGEPSALTTLETTAREDMATMTMTGYKGGTLQSQINQDRALVVGPYYSTTSTATTTTERRLLGVFDGHAARGELVSEYVVKELPKMLARKLQEAFPETTAGPQDDEISTTKAILHETFVELDRTAPGDPSGGCTATVVLMQGDHIYIANAGDSQSIIGVYRKKSQTTHIAYVSREDKPSLPDERARVEEMGGYVYIPLKGTSRVVWVNPKTGAQTGLAMSRSIGDWVFGKIGVIPDPIVDVVSIPELVEKELQRSRAMGSECWTVDDEGVVSRHLEADLAECKEQSEPPSNAEDEDDVYIFAVSATDGMLDYVSKDGIAQVVAQSLFEDDAPHPATACELLVATAAQGWDKHRQGRYRDDIAISISVMRAPPKTARGSSTASATSSQSDEL